jgi:multidrug resistance efflux pump
MAEGLNETLAKRKAQRIQQRQATTQRIAQGLGQSILTESERQQVRTIYDGRLALEEAKVAEAQAQVAQAQVEDLEKGD